MSKKQKFYFKKDNASTTLYNLKKYPIAFGFLVENWTAIVEEYKRTNMNAKKGSWPKPANTSVEIRIYRKLAGSLGFKKVPTWISFFAHGTHGEFVRIRPKL